MNGTELYERMPGFVLLRLEPVKTVVRLFRERWANIVTCFRCIPNNAPDEPVWGPVPEMPRAAALRAVSGKPEGQGGKERILFEGLDRDVIEKIQRVPPLTVKGWWKNVPSQTLRGNRSSLQNRVVRSESWYGICILYTCLPVKLVFSYRYNPVNRTVNHRTIG
jgi:hypothetical protein